MASSPITELVDGIERFLAALSDSDFAALVARVRAPSDSAPAEDSPTEFPADWQR